MILMKSLIFRTVSALLCCVLLLVSCGQDVHAKWQEQLDQNLSDDIKSSLPSIEEIENELKDVKQ